MLLPPVVYTGYTVYNHNEFELIKSCKSYAKYKGNINKLLQESHFEVCAYFPVSKATLTPFPLKK